MIIVKANKDTESGVMPEENRVVLSENLKGGER